MTAECFKLGTVSGVLLYILHLLHDAVPANDGVTTGGRGVTGEHLEGGRLAGAVDAEETEALALGYTDRHAALCVCGLERKW